MRRFSSAYRSLTEIITFIMTVFVVVSNLATDLQMFYEVSSSNLLCSV